MQTTDENRCHNFVRQPLGCHPKRDFFLMPFMSFVVEVFFRYAQRSKPVGGQRASNPRSGPSPGISTSGAISARG